MEKIIKRIRDRIHYEYEKTVFSGIEKRAGNIRLNSEKPVFYIIRRDRLGAGFFSNYFWVLGHTVYAVENKMIPVVDMKHYKTFYHEKKKIRGTDNAWNYYFEEPDGVTLKKAYQSRNYKLSEFRYLENYAQKYCGEYGYPSREAVEYYQPYLRQYFKIHEDLLREFEQKMAQLNWKQKKILGVHYRGTDMKYVQNTDHFRPLSLQNYLEEVKKLMNSSDYTDLFLATDEEYAVNEFCQEFGDKVMLNHTYRAAEETSVGIHEQHGSARKNHQYLLGLEVLEDAFFLSKCQGFVCGLSNVAFASILWNQNKYQEIKLLTGGRN